MGKNQKRINEIIPLKDDFKIYDAMFINEVDNIILIIIGILIALIFIALGLKWIT